MKRKIGAIIVICLIMLGALGLAAYGSGVTISQTAAGSTTDLNHPAAYLADGKSDTYWCLRAEATQGWVQLTLAKPALIYGLKLTGSLGADTKLTVEYQSGGNWLPFTAATVTTMSADGRLDLSWDRVVTQTLRIRLSGSDSASSFLSEVEVLGESASSILHRLQPEQITTDTNTSPNAPVCFLSDGNTYTGWQLRGSATQGTAVFAFPTESTLKNINLYFNKALTGNITFEAFTNNTWEHIASVSNQPAGWYRLAFNNTITTTKVRLIVFGCSGTDTALSEVEFWGYGDFSGDTRQVIGDQEPVAIAPSTNTANTAISDGGIKVLYSSANTSTIINSLQHNLKLYNTGTTNLNLADVKLRYWYTNEPTKQQVAQIYWSNIGAQNITTQFATVANRDNADTYLEIGFSAAAGTLAPGSYVEIKLGLNANDWTNYNQQNDFSFINNTNYTENTKYTGYLNNTRVWGKEPDSTIDTSVNLQFTKPTSGVLGNQAADGRLKVLCQSGNTATITNSLQTNLKFENTSGVPLDLTKVKLRYWYTNDTQKPQVANTYWASCGNDKVKASFGTVASVSVTADTYLELGFTGGTLQPGATVEIKLGLNTNDWANYKQTNDYSFNGGTTYSENSKVTGYIDHKLAWGIEPDTRPVFDNTFYRLELAFTGKLTGKSIVEVNNTQLELQPALTLNDRTIYCGQLTAAQLWEGVNYLRIKPFTTAATLENAFLTRHNPDGECPIALEGLSDGLLLTAAAPTATEWQFDRPILIEEATVTTTDNSAARLLAFVNDNWIELTNWQNMDWGTRFTGPVTTNKLKLEAPGSTGELIIKGSMITDQAPIVKIFWPHSGDAISLQGWTNQEVMGLVDNPQATVDVNGNRVTLEGHCFTLPLSKITAANGETVTITATAKDLTNRTGSASVAVTAGEYSEVTLDQADTLFYTAASTFTISGTVNNQPTQYQVNVAGTSTAISGNRFVTSVSLKEGLNLIEVQAIKNNQLVKTFYRRVVRSSGALTLTIQTPESGAYLNTQTVNVSGSVKGLAPFQVTVNGVAATVAANTYTATVTLTEGTNKITVVGRDATGKTITKTMTVNRDTTAPTITGVTPTEGTIFATAVVTATAKVTDANTFWVTINGQAVIGNAGVYQNTLSFTDGNPTITITAQDAAGNTTTAIVNVTVDTTAPLNFTPVVNVTGWTNNNKPTITFSTTDATSGIDHYEISVDDGASLGVVASPYQFATALAEGERTIQVMAYDKAGNVTVGTVKVDIDTIAPSIPSSFEVIGGVHRMILKWQGEDPQGEIVGYRIIRTPNFTSGSSIEIRRASNTSDLSRYVDDAVTSGAGYTYTLQAIDHAGNYSAVTAALTAKVSSLTQEVTPSGGTYKFDNCQLTIPEGAITTVGKVILKEVDNALPDNHYATKTGSAYQFTLVDQAGQEVRTQFNKPVTLTVNYTDLAIPSGFAEANLGIYWYNKAGGYWEKLDYATNDFAEKTLTVQLHHFSDYQVMASTYMSPSLDSYYNMGVSPVQGYFQNNTEYVSPFSGSLAINATDFTVPGRSGNGFTIQRIYDSAAAEQDKMLQANSDYDLSLPLDMFGSGWYLNIPWIERTDKGKFIRLPQGQKVQISLDANNIFIYHAGTHFIMNYHDGAYTLTMNDGTKYEFNSSGQVTTQTDLSGKNVITYEYNNREITQITDALGHVIHFEYQTAGSQRVIAKITVGNRAVNYQYDSSSNLIEVDVPVKYKTIGSQRVVEAERKTRYAYQSHTFQSGIYCNMGTDSKFSYSFSLLNAITYPTGETSKYTYQILDQSCDESKKIKLFGITIGHIRCNYFGAKVLLQKHQVAGKETTYTYQMNGRIGSLLGGGFVPAYTYMTAAQITEGNRINKLLFQQVEGNSLVNTPSNINNYKGPLVTQSSTVIGDSQVVERVSFRYNVPLRAVTGEDHYRGGRLVYSVTSDYDSWGNLVSHIDGSRNLEETWAYYEQDELDIKNLVATNTVKNLNPLTNTASIVTTIYTYDDQLGKMSSVTVNDGMQTKTAHFTYDAWGNLETKIDQANDNLKTKVIYDDAHHAFPEKQIIYGVRDADGKTFDITTRAEFDPETGLKKWSEDARGFRTSYEYDDLNRITKITLPDDDQDNSNNPYREFVFHDDANTCDFYNEKRQKSTFTFDGLGRLTRITKFSSLYPNGVTTVYHYDPYGRISDVTDPRGKVTAYTYDDLNRVTQVTYPGGATATLSYDDTTNTTTVTDEIGGVVSEQKDWAGRLIAAKQYCVKDGYTDTYSWQFTYDSLGNRLRQVDPQSNQTDQEFDVLGHLLTVKMPTVPAILPGTTAVTDYQPQVGYEYNAAGFKTGTISANENAKGTKQKINYAYDQLGRVISTTAKAQDIFTGQTAVPTSKVYYDAAGNKVKTVDGNGGVCKYTYSARGWLLTETDQTGNTTRYRYDVLGNKTAVTDPRGNGVDGTFTTWYKYDELNRLVKTILPDATQSDLSDNPSIEVTYDEVGNKLTEKDPNGVITSYTYNARNWVETVSVNGQQKTKYIYDAKGNQKEIHDALGNVTNKVYDSLGRIVKVTSEGTNAISETYSYDEVGNKLKVTDGRGNTTKYTYNSLGWVTQTTDPLGQKTQSFYDPNGNIVKVITPNNLVLQNNYDELNRLVEQLDSLSHATKSNYDAAGNRKQVIDRRGTTWVYQYYPDNQLKRLDLTGADGSSYYVEYTYDAAGNRMKTADSGNTVLYNYQEGSYQADPLNRTNTITRIFDGANYQTAYQYDRAGLLTEIKYPEATKWLKYNYNELNQLNEVEGFTTAQGMTYDANGALEKLTFANGVTASYRYDNISRLEDYQVKLNGSNLLQQHYTYDKSNNITAITEGTKTKTYDYDANNQLTRSITPGEFTEPNATPGTYGLKTNDQLGAATVDFAPTVTAMVRLDYNSSSVGIDFGTTVAAVKQIKVIPDKAYRTHRIVERTLDLYTSSDNVTYTIIPKAKWTFAKDDKGVITVTLKDRTAARYLKVHVKFDDRDTKFKAKDKATFLNDFAKMLRVYQEATSRTEEFAYDADGNRTMQRITLVQTNSYTSAYYTNSDRLKTDGKYAFTYDAAGNMVEKGNQFAINGDTVTFTTSGEDVVYWQYKYDLLNQLIAVTKNGTLVSEYAYDPDGLRVVKKAGGVTTHYVFEGTEPIFEKKITTGKIKSYVYAVGKYLARVDGVIGDATAKKYFYHTDHLGSIRVVTDQDAKTVYQADYHAFGSRYDDDGDIDEEHGFTGKEYDSDTGLYYYNARWYDSELGRFISEDPAADPNNPNLYSYCGNSPVMRSDPSGEAYIIDDIIAYMAIMWVANAVNTGNEVSNDGGSWSTGFAYGLAHPTISFQVSGYQDSDGNWRLGQRPETTGSIADVYMPDVSEDVVVITNNNNDAGSQASVGDIYNLDSEPIIQFASVSNRKSWLSIVAEIADHSYKADQVKERGKVIGGFKLIDHYSKGSLLMGIYQKVDGTENYIIANAGTNPLSGADWVNDIQQPYGESVDVKNSIAFAKDFVSNHPNANILFVGHSKGGGEAVYNAIATKKYNAILFNPAPVNLNSWAYNQNISTYSGRIISYVVRGEILSRFGPEPDPIRTIYLPQQVKIFSPVINSIGNHLMSAVKGAINQYEEGI